MDYAPPDQPAQKGKEYTIKRDNFSFGNDSPSFFKRYAQSPATIVAGGTVWFYGTYGYLMTIRRSAR